MLAVVLAPLIHVYSCQTFSGTVFVPQTNEVGLAVRFTNTSENVYKTVVWRAAYGDGYVDFVDNGTFSPDVPVDNFVLYKAGKDHVSAGNVLADLIALRFGNPSAPDPMVSPNQFTTYAGSEDPENCTIVSAADANGNTWTNPNVTPPHARIPAAASYGLGAKALKPAPVATGGIEVSSCSYRLWGRATMGVDFRNTGQQVVRQIVFRAPYRGGGVDFTDSGAFTPNVKIEHAIHANMPADAHATVYSSFDDPSACAVVSVTYADGTTWQNPAVAATPGPFATPVPNALDYSRELINVWSRAQVHGSLPAPSSPAPSQSPNPAR
jgi:hypothetical protein